MSKKDDIVNQPSKQELGAAIADFARSLVNDPSSLAALFAGDEDDEEMSEEELAQRAELAAQFRQIAATPSNSLLGALQVAEQLNSTLWQTLWQDEEVSEGELQVADMKARINELQTHVFAPWLMTSLQQELANLADTDDDDVCIQTTMALVSALSGLAHQTFDSSCYEVEPAEDIPKDPELFEQYWMVAMQISMNMYADDEDDDDEDEEFNEAQLTFMELSVVEKYQFLVERLQAHGVEVQALSSAQLSELQDQDYFEFGAALTALVPERTTMFAVEPFGCYTEQELHAFYPEHWQAASEATGGEWRLQDLSAEVVDDEINVSFKAFAQQHEWTYCHDSSYADVSFFEDLAEFAEQHLSGRFVIDTQNSDFEIGYVYLPVAAADEIAEYLKTV